jgi:hypothetical protein
MGTNSCTYSAVAVDSAGNLTITCTGGPVPPNPTNPTTPTNPPTCPTYSTVGPAAGYEGLTNVRFNLRPGEVGSIPFTLPVFDAWSDVKITGVGATYSETPRGSSVLLSVSDCRGEFIHNVSDSCRTVGSFLSAGLVVGTNKLCRLEAGKQYYLNVKFVDSADWNKTSCINPVYGYCSYYFKFGQASVYTQ